MGKEGLDCLHHPLPPPSLGLDWAALDPHSHPWVWLLASRGTLLTPGPLLSTLHSPEGWVDGVPPGRQTDLEWVPGAWSHTVEANRKLKSRGSTGGPNPFPNMLWGLVETGQGQTIAGLLLLSQLLCL